MHATIEKGAYTASDMAETLIGSEIIKLAGEVNEQIKKGNKIFNLTIGDYDPAVFPIPDALKNEALEFSLQAGEKIGFVFPIYSWAPPEIVLNFIRQLSLKGYKRQYLFFHPDEGPD